MEEVRRLTENKGVDVAMEAAGIPETFEPCEGRIAPAKLITHHFALQDIAKA